MKNDADMAQCNYKIGMGDDCEFEEEVSKEEVYSGIEYLRNAYSGIVCCKLYKAEIWIEGRLEFPVGRIYEEAEVTCKSSYRADKIVCISNCLYYYFQSADSITRRRFDLRKLDFLTASERRAEFYLEIGEKRLYDNELKVYKSVLLRYYYCVKKYYPKEKEILKELHGKICKTYKILKKSDAIRIHAKIGTLAGIFMPYWAGFIYEKIL